MSDVEPKRRRTRTKDSRKRGYCFTYNNPRTGFEFFLELVFGESQAKYLVYQLETGESGTPHVQGYIFWDKPQSFSQVKALLGDEVHIEAAKGTPAQNKTYCTKTTSRLGGPWEFGEFPQKGKRKDLEIIREKLDAGVSLSVVSQEHFGSFVRYSRGFKEYLLLNRPQRNWPMEVTVYWGPSGVGKSRTILEEHPGAYWKTKNSGQMQFWDGYNNEETIVIDEFYGWMSYDFLLRLTDRYPMSLEVKHGTVPIAARKILFTSNKHPRDWYNYERMGVPSWGTYQPDGTPFNPLERRIQRIVGLGVTVDDLSAPRSVVARVTGDSAFDT